MNCKPKILIHGDFFFIAQCTSCKKINLQYNNLVVKFGSDYFNRFCNAMEQVDFNESSSASLNGERQIIINTAHQDIQFTFSIEEFEELRDILQQAKMVLAAEDILARSVN